MCSGQLHHYDRRLSGRRMDGRRYRTRTYLLRAIQLFTPGIFLASLLQHACAAISGVNRIRISTAGTIGVSAISVAQVGDWFAAAGAAIITGARSGDKPSFASLR